MEIKINQDEDSREEAPKLPSFTNRFGQVLVVGDEVLYPLKYGRGLKEGTITDIRRSQWSEKCIVISVHNPSTSPKGKGTDTDLYSYEDIYKKCH